MLKETFKMRKIGKHLVNVSMLSLAIAPVVGSALAPVTALAAEYKSGQAGSNKLEFTTKSSTSSTSTKAHEPMDLIQIIDLSGSVSDGEYKQRNGVSGARKRQINDMIYVIEHQLTDQDHVMLAFYGTNNGDSYTVGGQDGGIATKLLSKKEAIDLLNKINANPQVHEMSQSWVLIPNVIKPMLAAITADAANGTGFEDVYKAQSNKNKVVSVLQFTDDWTASESEDIDTSFASWAKSTAKTFMTVVDTSLPDEALSVKQMKKAGHPNIKVFNRLDAPGRSEEIAKLFESTATVTKTTTTKQKAYVSITPEDGITLTKASLVSADGKTTDLKIDGNKVSADLNDLADGKYTVNYSFKGDVKSVKKITSSVSVDGKEVDKKEDTISPVAPPPAPVKPVEPKVTKRTEKIPFKTETKEDPTLPEGEKKVIQKGVEGEKEYVTTTLEDVAGQDGTAEGSVMFTTKASVTTSNEIKPRSIFAIIDNSGSVGGGNDPRIRSSFIPLLETMGPNDQIQIATYGVNQKESYFSNGADDRERMVTKMMNRDEFAKLAEEILASKTGTTREAILNQKLVYDFKGVKQSGSGYEFEDIFDTARNKDYTPVVMQFTDGWEYEEDIDHSFAEWSKAHAKTFMSVLYNTGRAEVAMKKAGHPNIFVAQGEFTKDSDQTKKVLDQIKATTTEVVKKGANQTVKISIGGQGVTVTKATLKGAVNKDLPIKDGKVEFSEALADGSYTLEYAAKGNGTLKSLVTVDGKEVGNKTVELKGTPGQKGESKTVENIIKNPINEIIHIGTKGAKSDVTEKKVSFETIRKEDPTLEEGKEKVIQEGVEGVIKVTTTYDTQKGQKVEGSEKVTEKETVKKVDKIIAVGTKGSKSEVTEKKVPFETIKKDDPTLEEGQEKVVQEGVEGVIKVTTTYETQKGEKVKGSEKVTEEKVTDKVDKIIAVGTKGSKSEVTEKKVPFETIYKQDPTLKKGEEKVLQEGVEGVIKVTTTYETQKGKKVDGSEKVTEETVTEKVDKIVAQGTMEKRKVRYRVVDSKGQELVKQTDVMEAYQDEEYKVETPKLDGYRLELAKDSVPATGKVTDRDVLVTFVAVKIGKPVTLKFIDESGSEIAQKKVLTGENAEVDTEFTGEAPETIEKDGVKYAFVGIKQTGSKERKVSGKVTDQEQVIEAVYAKPKELPKTSEQAKQRNTAIIALLSVVGLGGLVTYFGLRKRDEK